VDKDEGKIMDPDWDKFRAAAESQRRANECFDALIKRAIAGDRTVVPQLEPAALETIERWKEFKEAGKPFIRG
jgi:hypothetical protein